jgi:hypothetical protein
MRIWDAINPVELTGYVRAALADLQVNQFTLGRWLPNREVRDLEYRFLNGGQGLIEAATFRTWDTESPIGSRPNVARMSGELPPISRKIRLGEYERMRLAGGVAAGDANDEIRNQVYNDGERLTRSIAARLELARGEALWSGKVELNENGVVATINFGRAAGHTVTAGVLWSDHTNADPLTDLLTWQTTMNTRTARTPRCDHRLDDDPEPHARERQDPRHAPHRARRRSRGCRAPTSRSWCRTSVSHRSRSSTSR